jgi:hypothetical protein
MDWGRLKPDYPRAYWDKESQQQTDKPIKYESPAITPNRVTYLMTLGRDFLTKRDAKRAKSQLEAGENSIWKPDSNKGQLISKVGKAIGVADGEPYWNAYLNQWQVWVNFADGCRSVVCDWLAVV